MDEVTKIINRNSFLFKLLVDIEKHHKNNTYNKIPNLLFNGTSTENINLSIIIICNILSNNTKYLAPIDENKHFNILLVDCIFNSSIIDIRNNVQQFIKSKFIKQQGHKIIIFNNLDELTDEAQCALRVLMEENNTNLFIGITMNINNIVSPILSRMLTLFIDDGSIKIKQPTIYKKNIFNDMKYNKYLCLLYSSKKSNIENVIKLFDTIKTELLKIKNIYLLETLFSKLEGYIYTNYQSRLTPSKNTFICPVKSYITIDRIKDNYMIDFETFILVLLTKHVCLMKKYEY
jgi:hypothetical protein